MGTNLIMRSGSDGNRAYLRQEKQRRRKNDLMREMLVSLPLHTNKSIDGVFTLARLPPSPTVPVPCKNSCNLRVVLDKSAPTVHTKYLLESGNRAFSPPHLAKQLRKNDFPHLAGPHIATQFCGVSGRSRKMLYASLVIDALSKQSVDCAPEVGVDPTSRSLTDMMTFSCW